MSRAEGFAAVPNWMIRDRRVPRNAILVYASLSSRAGMGAIFPSQAKIAEECGLSERTVRTMLNSLEDLGVVERRSRRAGEGRANRKTDAYTLHPNGRADEPADIAGRSEQPANGGRATGNQQHAAPLIEVDREEVDRDTREVVLLPRIDFDSFWSVWPKKVAKPDALRAWEKALKTTSAETIVAGAVRYRDNPGIPEKQFIPYPATWLRREGWNDELPVTGGRDVAPLQRARDTLDIAGRLQDEADRRRAVGA